MYLCALITSNYSSSFSLIFARTKIPMAIIIEEILLNSSFSGNKNSFIRPFTPRQTRIITSAIRRSLKIL